MSSCVPAGLPVMYTYMYVYIFVCWQCYNSVLLVLYGSQARPKFELLYSQVVLREFNYCAQEMMEQVHLDTARKLKADLS